MALLIQGRLKIGAWVEAWYLRQAALYSKHIVTETEVFPVLAAPWKRSARTDWVWRYRDREYPKPNTFGGSLETSMGEVWGRYLFPDEVAAWSYAVADYERRLATCHEDYAQEVKRREAELQDARGLLAMARLRALS